MNSNSILDSFIKLEGLSEEYRSRALRYFIPLSDLILSWKGNETLYVGMNGAQGSGKSTLARFIQVYLRECYSLSVVILSLDDLYLTRKERLVLARDVHPLFKTRGVPGTHDIKMGIDFINCCKSGNWNKAVCPAFNKSIDDREEKPNWYCLAEKPDIILFEGWCMGVAPQPDEDLVSPLNDLEAKEDSLGIWRRHVNEHLKGHYKTFFEMFSHWVVLQPKSFDFVVKNRIKQEVKLRSKLSTSNLKNAKIMSDSEIIHFVAHFERLTKWMWNIFKEQADVLIELGENHIVESMVVK